LNTTTNSKISNKVSAHVFRSLVVIIFINIGGFFLTAIVRIFVLPRLLDVTPIQDWFITSSSTSEWPPTRPSSTRFGHFLFIKKIIFITKNF
jgi:hypothetical protein